MSWFVLWIIAIFFWSVHHFFACAALGMLVEEKIKAGNTPLRNQIWGLMVVLPASLILGFCLYFASISSIAAAFYALLLVGGAYVGVRDFLRYGKEWRKYKYGWIFFSICILGSVVLSGLCLNMLAIEVRELIMSRDPGNI